MQEQFVESDSGDKVENNAGAIVENAKINQTLFAYLCVLAPLREKIFLIIHFHVRPSGMVEVPKIPGVIYQSLNSVTVLP